MEKRILYKFFQGTASTAEKEEIRLWLNSDPDHKEELVKERAFFNAVTLSENKTFEPFLKTKKDTPQLYRIVREALKLTAMIAILATLGLYFYYEKMKQIELAVNTIIVPAGQRANIILPDGTNVWLNACSEIKYPAYFTGSKREVELKGEAYFDVTVNKSLPFVVHTQRWDIEVLGTKFNVESYPDTDHFSTALLEGAVRISSNSTPNNAILLSPDYKVKAKDGVLSTELIDDYDVFRWQEGLLCFKETRFEEMIERFEKYYNIHIIINKKQILDYEYSGKFRISDGLENALRLLQKDMEYIFEIKSEDSTIYIN